MNKWGSGIVGQWGTLRLPLLVFLLSHYPTVPLPAQSYFQQDVRYTLRMTLDEPSAVATGAGTLVYRNNSPDTLRDLYFHLYLNAFRPNSMWSADEEREGNHRFANLQEPNNAFEHLQQVSIGGVSFVIDYPNEPDSTIAHVRLFSPLRPGDSLMVQLAWEARPSTIARRQGHRGRRFDFAQGYPKISVYDRYGWEAHPFHLAGELYGEFGTYDVTLDLPEDQVAVATGLPVAGDPGWERANAGSGPVNLQRDFYGPASRPGVIDWDQPLQPGRKRVRFYAEHIHHFAWSVNPQYRYEEGRLGDVVLRTLYLPEDSATWGHGRVIQRIGRAMTWLQSIYGPYPYPQTVAIHRIDGGGTEFPMVVMNGGPDEGLIFHEVGHIFTYGILGNNEWKEGWLDEGFTSFQSSWYQQQSRPRTTALQQSLVGLDLDHWSEPVSTVSEDFASFGIYNTMIYSKGQLIYEMLKDQLGEETFRRGLHIYYERWKLKHVDETAFRVAMEEASHRDLRQFFAQWLHATPLVDYGVGPVHHERLDDGSWRTTAHIVRYGDGTARVEVVLGSESQWVDGEKQDETVTFITPDRPGKVELDPRRVSYDWNYLNNVESLWIGSFRIPRGPKPVERFGWSSTTPALRDRWVENWMPLAWYNDAGGFNVGFQSRTNYLGRFDQFVSQLTYAIDRPFNRAFNYYSAIRNPVQLRAPRLRWGLEGWHLEGRLGGRLYATRDASRFFSFGPRRSVGASLTVMDVRDTTYVDPARWTNALTVELASNARMRWIAGQRITDLTLTSALGGAVSHSPLPNSPLSLDHRYLYSRITLDARHRRPVGRFELRARVYGGLFLHPSSTPLFQRSISLAGADPYETFNNPFIRSRGALFVRDDVNYAAPGGAGLRGFAQGLGADRAAALNLEFVRTLFRKPQRRVLNSVTLATFADAAIAGGPAIGAVSSSGLLADAGVGIRATHRIGPTTFTTRLDFPILVSSPAAAAGARSGDGRAKLRFVWSLEEAL